jgi:hypothetical protein
VRPFSRTLQHSLALGRWPVRQGVRFLGGILFTAGLLACNRKSPVRESPRMPEPPAVITSGSAAPAPPSSPPDTAPSAPVSKQPAPRLAKLQAPPPAATQTQWKARMASANPETKAELIGEALATGEEEAAWIFPAAQADGSAAVRAAAANELHRLSDSSYARYAPVALNDPASAVRQTAIEQLGGRPPETMAPVLAAALASDFPEVREAAFDQLATRPNAALLEVFLAGLDDPDKAFRRKVRDEVRNLVGKEFDNSQQAAAWWKVNQANYSSDLVYLGE